MAKPKENKAPSGMKRERDEGFIPLEGASASARAPPSKKAKLLDDSDVESDADDSNISLKVNEEYARRFEHNKKREEQHRLEEKYGKSTTLQPEDDDSEDSQEGVEEDDDGALADEAIDDEISATLQALRSKDPRIYNKDYKFYQERDEGDQGPNGVDKGESMTLKQYHTRNLLDGKISDDEEEDAPPKTYAQEQEEARQNLVKEMQEAGAADEDEDEDDFLVAKPKPAASKTERVKLTAEDVEKADEDPETFLSNFMAARAWVTTDNSRFQPLESDDEEEEAAAEEWENTYNMYFEDSAGANEKIVTYARDAVASTTVRREEPSSRRKAREAARAKREAERKEREQDLARLRKLKIEEMEQKVKKIRKTAGLHGRDFKVDEWKEVLEGDWSDDQWDVEMRKRFGDAYYEDDEAASGTDTEDKKGKKKKQPKKPKFDDDIDIKDLIPGFKDDEDEQPAFTLSSDEDEANADANGDKEDDDEQLAKSSKSSKKRKQERAEAKSAARRDRRLIENLVDSSLEYEAALASSTKPLTRFRYRETSPTTFGLTPRDILLANDAQLNEFAGLKKLATFRDPSKKKKDKKHLSKKARLRQWRLDTFGDADGPKGGFETLLVDEARPVDGGKAESGEDASNIVGEGRKKKRSRKKKSKSET